LCSSTADEHYIATLFVKLKRENETDCGGLVAKEFFNQGSSHPQTFYPSDISADQ